MKGKLITLQLLFLSNILIAQEYSLNLFQAIEIAKTKSFDFKVALNKYQTDKWRFENYKASRLPTLSLSGTIPNYARSINRITLPNGEDTFVSQNQSFSTLNLGLFQNISSTGGTVSVGSVLNRLDVFGSSRQTNYATVPVSISYSQTNLGYNHFKWQKKIEPLRLESAQRELVTSFEKIAAKTVANYFDLIAAQTQRELSSQNLVNADILYRIAKDRFGLGKVSQSELLQLRMNILKAQNKVAEDSIYYVLACQQFSRYLLMETNEWRLDLPKNVVFFKIALPEALAYARENSQSVIDFRMNRLQAERNLAETKAQAGLKFNIHANFGLTGSARSLPSVFNRLENQQNVALGFSLPLLDWGFAKTQKLQAEANLKMVESTIEQQSIQMEQEISLYVSRWNLHEKYLNATIESREIAKKNYELEVERYKTGILSINDLNIAQNLKDAASTDYIAAIRTYWDLYFIIRTLTLYDFEKKRKINQ